MRICYEWLKDYIEIKKTPEELADDLTLFGHEVDEIKKEGEFTILDFEITPNRGDLLSIYGMVREISALYDLPLKKEEIKIDDVELDKKIDVKIQKPEICPRFTARVIDNVKVGETPEQIKKYLASYGFRSLNNIVDITNYVMLVTGQPLHAFDYDKIKNGQMNIHLSKANEEVMTLDGKNHVLKDGAIIISDEEKVYDLAGIMGGYKSEVDENTKTIVLQGAIFDPVLIRRASKYLRHMTDASYRYERGVDYEGSVYGVDMASFLIKETSKEAKIGKLIDIKSLEFKPNQIELDVAKVNKLIGINIDFNTAKDYLENLGFVIDGKIATVPSYRNYDVKIWQDLAEEIARMYGYNKIPKFQFPNDKYQKKDTDWVKREAIKDYLKELGFTEAYSYSFADKDKIKLLGFNVESCIETANPIAPELKYLRPSLLPSILNQISKNPWAPEVNLFEIGKSFEKEAEKWQLVVVTVGKNENLLSRALEGLKITGEIKNLDQKVLDSFKIRRPVKYFIFDVEKINIDLKDLDNQISQNKYKPISKYPPTIRDLAFIVNEKIKSSEVEKEIQAISESILLVELFDEFSSDKFGEGNKNLAYHIWLQNMDGPVEEKDAMEITQKITQLVEDKFQAKLRS